MYSNYKSTIMVVNGIMTGSTGLKNLTEYYLKKNILVE